MKTFKEMNKAVKQYVRTALLGAVPNQKFSDEAIEKLPLAFAEAQQAIDNNEGQVEINFAMAELYILAATTSVLSESSECLIAKAAIMLVEGYASEGSSGTPNESFRTEFGNRMKVYMSCFIAVRDEESAQPIIKHEVERLRELGHEHAEAVIYKDECAQPYLVFINQNGNVLFPTSFIG